MKDQSAPSLFHPEVIFLSLFGVGFLPKAPGTWGSLATLPFLYGLNFFKAPFFLFLPFLLMSTTITCFIAHFAQRKYSTHDPSWIVIDEALGMWTAWLFTQNPHSPSPYHDLFSLLTIFLLFRFFDILKFWPASFFDKMENGAGVILDDIISGLFAGIAYLIFSKIFSLLS